jgi:hypothetical protein
MSLGFLKALQLQLARTARIRRLIDNELSAANPSALRLVRLRLLQIITRRRIKELSRAAAFERDPAPRQPRQHSRRANSETYFRPIAARPAF